jgi:prepilin-type N-terminal cleavage/methylation domain-containing protein
MRIKTARASLSKDRRQDVMGSHGFTLIELIVVVSLISLMLFFAIPRLSSDFLAQDLNAASRWIIVKVKALKDQAYQEQQRFIMHIDLNTDRIWISNVGMTAEELENAAATAFQLPDDVKLLDVEYPSQGKITSGEAEIWFFENGYSQKVLIHMTNDANEIRSFLIEPFLPSVKVFTEAIEFES